MIATTIHMYAPSFRGKRLRVFLCGDYEFLTRVLGISGASGKVSV